MIRCHSLSMTAMCSTSMSSDKQSTGDNSSEVKGFTQAPVGSQQESGGFVSRCHLIASNEKNTMALSPFI
ncbi:hypothetical protein CesoFtcFv8_026970 [Champsocephalus esox]|uniref:Uncharacterized protein n=1 Tax=Champsocephalus esox TaxID=159716 RepID=A0AAN8GAA8_9TELE|nr:hypothetical protein CesoFtcFv8_026970 [Champsocephalus esox]